MNWKTINMKCRLCLIASHEGNCIFLFANDEETNLTKLIAKYLYIEVTQLDVFSTIICNDCVQHLNDFHKFFKFIEEQQQVLKNEFLEIKCVVDERPLNTSTNLDNVENCLEHNDESLLDMKYIIDEHELNRDKSTLDDEFGYADEHFNNEQQNESESDEDDDVPLQTLRRKAKTEKLVDKPAKKLSTKKKEKNCRMAKSTIRRKYKSRKRKSKEETQVNELISKTENSEKLKEKSENTKKYLTPEENKLRDEMVAKYIDLKCEICSERVETYDHLKIHFRKQHNRKAYITCCNVRFLRRFLLLDHIKMHLNPEQFKCNLCDKVLKSKNNLNIHNRNMHAGREKLKHACTLCNKRFQHLSTLNHHMFVHKEERDHICDICKKGFKSSVLLNVHIEHMHTAERAIFVCETCGKEYRFKMSFDRHVAQHQGRISDPTGKCHICGKWYTLKNLKKHLKRHELEESNCEQCGKTFKSKSALATHISYAHSRKIFNCTYCEKTFKRPCALKEHIAMHTGRKDYNCPHCPKEFRSKANMYSHIKKIHVEEWASAQLTRYKCPNENFKMENT